MEEPCIALRLDFVCRGLCCFRSHKASNYSPEGSALRKRSFHDWCKPTADVILGTQVALRLMPAFLSFLLILFHISNQFSDMFISAYIIRNM